MTESIPDLIKKLVNDFQSGNEYMEVLESIRQHPDYYEYCGDACGMDIKWLSDGWRICENIVEAYKDEEMLLDLNTSDKDLMLDTIKSSLDHIDHEHTNSIALQIYDKTYIEFSASPQGIYFDFGISIQTEKDFWEQLNKNDFILHEGSEKVYTSDEKIIDIYKKYILEPHF